MSIFLLILGLVLFVGLVVVHELGHFMVARRGGVKVEEFGIGFPPRAKLLAKRRGTSYTLNWLPLGGFVRLKGEHDADTAPHSFGAASVWVKSKIMLAGVGMNLLVAMFIFTVVALIGIPKLITKDQFGENQFTVASDTRIVKDTVIINAVEPGSPAANAGIASGDTIVSISPLHPLMGSGLTLKNASQLPVITKNFAGQQVVVMIKRTTQTLHFTLTLLSRQIVDNSKGTKHYLGVSPTDYIIQRNTWSAPLVAAGLSAQLTKLTLRGLWTAMRGLASIIAGLATHNTAARRAGQVQASQVSGPVGIFFVLKAGASQGFIFILFIIGLISLTLAIMNVLPIPALDGGRLYLLIISRKILRKPLQSATEERIIGISFAALLVLVALITIVDVKR